MSMARPKQKVIVRMNAPAERRRGFRWMPLLIICLFGAIALTVFRWESGMEGAIYPGVTIAGVNVGGDTIATARRQLQPLAQALTAREISVLAGGHTWKVTPSQMGMRLDLDQRLQEAYAVGREDNLLDRYSTQITTALQGRGIALIGNYDSSTLQTFVQQMARDVFQEAQPAVVSLQNAKAVVSTHATSGVKLDQQVAATLLAGALADIHQTVVHVPVTAITPAVSEAEANREVASLRSILGAKLHLRFGSRSWLLDASSIAPAIALTTVIAPGGAATYQHSLDQAALTRYVDNLGAQIDQPMKPSTVTIHDARIAVAPGQNGLHLDRFATKQVLAQAILQGGTQDISLPGGVTQMTTPIAAAQVAARQAAELIRRPLALTYHSYSWLLGPSQLGSTLVFIPRRDPVNGPVLDVRVDPAKLAQVLGPVTSSVATKPVDAHFVATGNHVLLAPSLPGRRVDFASLAPSIEGRGRIISLPLPVQLYQPQLSTTKAEAMGIHDLLISHSTYFPGSSAARLTNIHAAVRHLDGQLIAPGAVFSFNQRIGDITAAGGYVEGINIVDNQDVPGIGGGVCQVAVTLFQSAIYAGLRIEERAPHANIVSYYNPVGMDATVYVSPNGPDVKFRNTTDHWILVTFEEDLAHDKLTARFFGTNPHFRVVVRGPTSKTEPNGDVDAVFYRTVYDSKGNVLLDAAFRSHYVPVGAAQ
jgi:vancomycin resistance protein YoaR